MSTEKMKSTFKKFFGFAAIAVLIAQSVGCSTLDNAMQEPLQGYRNHVWANRAYNLRYGDCERRYSEDFKNGFVDGYCGVCDGGDGYVPATAPDNYWGYQYQSPEGAGCVNAWFQGFPLGAAAAKKDGGGAFHDVYISKMMQSALTQDTANHILPDDVPVVAPQRPGVEPYAGSNTSQAIPNVNQAGSPQAATQTQRTQTPLPSIIQSSSFVPRDSSMVVPSWDVNAGSSSKGY